MSLFLSPIHPTVREELERRQRIYSREAGIAEGADFLAQKTPWIKLTSNAIPRNIDPELVAIDIEIDLADNGDKTRIAQLEERKKLLQSIQKKIKNFNEEHAKQLILYGGTINEDGSFREGFDEIYGGDMTRPMPGITGISVENKGDFGSIRTSTINWVCWSIEQLELLERLYMVPGVSCLLEWGWSSTEAAIEMFNIADLDNAYAMNVIRKKSLESNGMYDAMMGTIVNFSWSMRDDGGFDCTTELTSPGEGFLNLKSLGHDESHESLGDIVDEAGVIVANWHNWSHTGGGQKPAVEKYRPTLKGNIDGNNQGAKEWDIIETSIGDNTNSFWTAPIITKKASVPRTRTKHRPEN